MNSGLKIGRYRLLERIGKGGMAEIFKAEESLPGGGTRLVAIKRLFPRLSADREFVGMFVNEARIASEMNHPCIVRTYDLINYGSYYYIVMEYLEGMDLEDLVILRYGNRPELSIAETAYIVQRVAMGLAYAHRHTDSKGRPAAVVHRDISPGNILVSVSGEVKITDFGIARATQYASFTRPGVLKGKYEYMAPEYVKGESFDGRADLFSLGVVLYELLTGTNPFSDVMPHEIWKKITSYDPPPPSRLVRGVPRLMDRVVARALRKDPRKRYQSGEEFAAELAGFYNPPPVQQLQQSLGARVHEALHEGDVQQQDPEEFLPPERKSDDSTREVYLDELLELVEPQEVPPPPIHAAEEADRTAPKKPLRRRRRAKWIAIVALAMIALAGAAAALYLVAKPKYGYLTIKANRRTEITVDGKRMGLTPLLKVPLEPGKHVIVARRPGTRYVRRYTRTIEPGQTSTLKIRWRKKARRKGSRKARRTRKR